MGFQWIIAALLALGHAVAGRADCHSEPQSPSGLIYISLESRFVLRVKDVSIIYRPKCRDHEVPIQDLGSLMALQTIRVGYVRYGAKPALANNGSACLARKRQFPEIVWVDAASGSDKNEQPSLNLQRRSFAAIGINGCRANARWVKLILFNFHIGDIQIGSQLSPASAARLNEGPDKQAGAREREQRNEEGQSYIQSIETIGLSYLIDRSPLSAKVGVGIALRILAIGLVAFGLRIGRNEYYAARLTGGLIAVIGVLLFCGIVEVAGGVAHP